MKLRILTAALIAGALMIQSPASAAPRAASVTALAQTTTWTGATTTGANTSFFATAGTCNSVDAQSYCDDTLVKLDVLKTDAMTQLKFRIADFGKPTDDFDIRVYTSDQYGSVGTYLGSPRGDVADTSPLDTNDPRHTGPGDFETKLVSNVLPGDYYLIRVVYFAIAQSNYKGSVQILNLPPQDEPTPAPAP